MRLLLPNPGCQSSKLSQAGLARASLKQDLATFSPLHTQPNIPLDGQSPGGWDSASWPDHSQQCHLGPAVSGFLLPPCLLRPRGTRRKRE